MNDTSMVPATASAPLENATVTRESDGQTIHEGSAIMDCLISADSSSRAVDRSKYIVSTPEEFLEGVPYQLDADEPFFEPVHDAVTKLVSELNPERLDAYREALAENKMCAVQFADVYDADGNEVNHFHNNIGEIVPAAMAAAGHHWTEVWCSPNRCVRVGDLTVVGRGQYEVHANTIVDGVESFTFRSLEYSIRLGKERRAAWLAEHGPALERIRPSWAESTDPLDGFDEDGVQYIYFSSAEFQVGNALVYISRHGDYDETTREIAWTKAPAINFGDDEYATLDEFRSVVDALGDALTGITALLNTEAVSA